MLKIIHILAILKVFCAVFFNKLVLSSLQVVMINGLQTFDILWAVLTQNWLSRKSVQREIAKFIQNKMSISCGIQIKREGTLIKESQGDAI